MANPPESLNLGELDSRFVNSLRDTNVVVSTRYRYIKDAYSYYWYIHPWEFRKAVGSLTVSAGVSEYALPAEVDLVRVVRNATTGKILMFDFSFQDGWDYGTKFNSIGRPIRIADIRSVNGDTLLVLHETPSVTGGHGDILEYYYFKHLVHNTSAGAVVTGNFSVSTDVPSLAPQFHNILVKSALKVALKDNRQLGDVYQAVVQEEQEYFTEMKKRYLTPQRNTRRIRIER